MYQICISIVRHLKMVAHSEILLSKCAQFRDEGQFIDVRLKVREDVFPAHRIVLAANSDYFHAMFTADMKESNQEVIELKDEGISPDALKIVMDSIYTLSADLRVNKENVFEVLAAADHLQVTTVVQQCCDFLKREFIQLRLDLQNYCLLSTVADRHGLRDLQEAAEKKMASMYVDVCEGEEFLSNVDADQLLRLLSRDDLSAPSETFIFKSVMQWIKHRKEERMKVAAKIIGAVRLGLVDIRVLIEELDTEEMERVPEIYKQLHEALIFNFMPSRNPKFAVGKTKTRATSPVLIAVLPQAQMQYFDVEVKTWKPLASTTPAIEATNCYSAVSAGNNLYVAGAAPGGGYYMYRYDTEGNVWDKQPHSCGQINNLCIVDDYMYAISSNGYQVPQRYSFSKCLWQTFNKANTPEHFQVCCSGATVLGSKVYVLYGSGNWDCGNWCTKNAKLQCFDPVKNEWEEKAEPCKPHFGSSLFVVNSKIYVAGGYDSIHISGTLQGNPAQVEVYDEIKNTWSFVEQKHIPPNNRHAVEIEGKVYFIINKSPVDSGIRIPPGELYPVYLGECENLAKIAKTAVLCNLPVKRESLKAE